jgi:small subunit ribosomal protein S17
MAQVKESGRTLVGEVVSAKANSSVSVAVVRMGPHPLYGKYIKRTTRLLAHDETNEAKEGDIVEIEQCRPVSRRKSWRLRRVLTQCAKI